MTAVTARVAAFAVLTANAFSCAGCVPSNVVAATDRSVVIEAERAEWQLAGPKDVPGLWSSTHLSGALAVALHKVIYHFEPDGHFTGAALLSGPPAAFQVLSGTWAFDADGRFRLGEDVEPAILERTTDGMLRLSGADGTVVLYREELR